MIDWAASADASVRKLLQSHPHVAQVEEGPHRGVDFSRSGASRSVVVDQPAIPVRGLIELMDNNPIVCADVVSVPSGFATLALIAFGPLAEAGLIVEEPTLIVSRALEQSTETGIANWLETVRWENGLTVHCEPQDLGSVLAATAMAAIQTPSDWSEIDDLYNERYSRSFFVRLDEESVWATSLVDEQPFTAYRLRLTPGNEHSLLTVHLLADEHGKCGAAQVVHAMNVMCGFEESVGIA